MTLREFKDWVSTLGSEAPSRTQWWELKARLEAVTEVAALAALVPTPAALCSAPRNPTRQAEADIVDDPPPVDPEDWGGDGGVAVEVVRALRAQQRDLRPARGARTPPGGADAV